MIIIETERLILRTWFDHPKLTADSPIRPHVLYRISREEYLTKGNE